jgi:phospholipid/cholesterol/gamma-HCH transport system ATP-binding protein
MISPNAVTVEDVYAGFNGTPVLKGLSFQLNRGGILAIVGRSGSGKSVLLKLLTGLMFQDSGRIEVEGVNVGWKMKSTEVDLLGAQTALVFQQGAFVDELTVWENIGLRALETSSVPESEIRKQVALIADAVGLLPVDLFRYPHELSGGMQKKAGIARAIFHKPSLILYDEPTSGLDPASAGVIDRLIIKMNQDFGLSTIIVTHDLDTLKFLQPEILMIHAGGVGYHGNYIGFMESMNPVVRSFIHR